MTDSEIKVDPNNKIVKFDWYAGFGMYDPIYIEIELQNGEKLEIEMNGRNSDNPMDYLKKLGYKFKKDKKS